MYLQNILNFIKIFFVISDYENLIFSFSDFSLSINAQDGFQILEDKKKVNIPFRQINNLVFLDLKVNNVDLTFC